MSGAWRIRPAFLRRVRGAVTSRSGRIVTEISESGTASSLTL